MWGNLTRAAVWNFQQENGMDPSGEVDRQTLSALGVQLASQDQGTVGSATTGSGAQTTGSGAATTGSGAATTGSNAGMDDAKPDNK
jgi:peptidoglycan hydrolase-like protein with peptidoglycan-binding domain